MKIVFSDVNMFVNDNLKGTVLTNLDVIQQSFYNILTTPIGTRYRQPTYGSYLPFLLQQQLTPDLVYEAKARALQAIKRWEPRVIVEEESVSFIQVDDTTIQGFIPYFVPEFNTTGDFTGVFVPD